MHTILNLLLKIATSFCFTKKNHILYESGEFVYDNSFYFYKFMEKKKEFKNYYCVYSESEYLDAIKKGISPRRVISLYSKEHRKTWNFKNLIRNLRLFKKCKYFVISYRYPGEYLIYDFKYSLSKKQILINLRHGQFPIKNVDSYYLNLCKYNTHDNYYFRLASYYSYEHYLPNSLKSLNCKWFFEESPRNDYLFLNKEPEFAKLLGIEKFSDYKIVLCLTTFRNSSKSFFSDSFPIDLSKDDFDCLEQYFEKNKILFLIKTHHESKVTECDKSIGKMKNILLRTTEDFENSNLFINEVFQYTSGLITDYSSAIFDYLLLNKPIGYAFGDYEAYSQNNGLNITIDKFVAGDQINNLSSLLVFLENIINSNDNYNEKRKNISNEFNYSNSGRACEKIYERFFK